MDIIQVITGELAVRREQVEAAVQLIDEANTIVEGDIRDLPPALDGL